MLDSLVAGLAPLGCWGTWMVMGAHMIVCVGVLILGGSMMGGGEPPERGAGRWTAGCLIGTIGHVVAVGAATGIAVGLLVPVLFGQDRLMEPSLLLDNAWQLVKYGLGGVLMSFLIAMIPIVGGLAAESPGFTVYITSICVFRGLVRPLLQNESIDQDVAFPGFWQAVGYGLLVAVLLFAIKWATAAVAAVAWRNERVAARVMTIAMVLGLASGVLSGFVPFFMYAAAICHAVDRCALPRVPARPRLHQAKQGRGAAVLP